MTTRKNWSKTIEESGTRARLYTRPGGATVYFSLVLGGKKIQRSTRLRDRKQAEAHAREVVRIIAEDQRAGRTSSPTLGQVFSVYFRNRAPLLTKDWRQAAETRRDLFEAAWGAAQKVEDIGETEVDRYCAIRRSGKLIPKGREPTETRKARGVRDGTLHADFRWLSSVFNWARKHKTNGRRLLAANPLHDVDWPKEKNIRRPVASNQRFVETLAKVDEVDANGRLRCMLALARYTGRRESAICQLRGSDILRSEQEVGSALAALGMDESRADHMPHGAIRWRSESDKQGFDEIAPLSLRARNMVDEYVIRNPRLGEAWLFPSPKDDTKPIDRHLGRRWLERAEKLAELPKLAGGTWHPYRRLWATERKNLPDVDVAAAGGWRDTSSLRLSYQQADPVTVLQVVEAGQ